MNPLPPHILVALDLGSESTAVAAKVGSAAPFLVDLQFFAYGLQATPDVYKEGGQDSKHLRTRFTLSDYHAQPGRVRTQPGSDLALVMPEDHATKVLMPGDALVNRTSWRDYKNTSESNRKGGGYFHPNNRTESLIEYFIDRSNVNAIAGRLLPNLKLMFAAATSLQSGYSQIEGICRAIRTDSGDSPKGISPAEMVSVQISQILTNFVQLNPDLLKSDGEPRPWSDFSIILTIPNTYSSGHANLIRRLTEENLVGAKIVVISESDAVSRFFQTRRMILSGITEEDLRKITFQYITFDIGKGTTDLSVMMSRWRPVEPSRRAALEIAEDDERDREHVYISARCGQPSGGAKVTYLFATFLDELARAIVGSHLPNAPVNKLTEVSYKGITEPPYNLMGQVLNLEALADWHKINVQDPSRSSATARLSSAADFPEVAAMARELAEFHFDETKRMIVASALHPVGTVLHNGVDLNDATARSQMVEDLSTALLDPQELVDSLSAQPPAHERGKIVMQAWEQLQKGIRLYVEENVDEVLCRLANDHLAGGPQGLLKGKNGARALRSICGEPCPKSVAAKAPEIKTYLVISGQGSQFKPLRRRIQEVIDESGKFVLAKGELRAYPKPSLLSQLITRLREVLGLLPKLKSLGVDPLQDDEQANVEDTTPIQRQHEYAFLEGGALKEGCVYGALEWLSEHLIVEGRDHIHGEYLATTAAGAAAKWADMEEINNALSGFAPKQVALRADNMVSKRILYYLPFVAEHTDNLASIGLTAEKLQKYRYREEVPAGAELTFDIDPTRDEPLQLRIGTTVLEPGAEIHGANLGEELRHLLWPVALPR